MHNYGHGGSGWSLSWGSSARAVRLAMQANPSEVAVIGCGALGLTSAILAQRSGARVTIHAREQLPPTTSGRATGEWTHFFVAGGQFRRADFCSPSEIAAWARG
ncbi:MAG: FAD-dependent oxidoreductase [Reyranellaceae bacterium]